LLHEALAYGDDILSGGRLEQFLKIFALFLGDLSETP